MSSGEGGDAPKPSTTSSYVPRTALGASNVASKYTSSYTPRTAALGSSALASRAGTTGPGATATTSGVTAAAKYGGYTPRTALGSTYTSSLGTAGTASAGAPTTASALANKYARPASAGATGAVTSSLASATTAAGAGLGGAKLELDKAENELSEKKRALLDAAAEIRSLKQSLLVKEKSLERAADEKARMEERALKAEQTVAELQEAVRSLEHDKRHLKRDWGALETHLNVLEKEKAREKIVVDPNGTLNEAQVRMLSEEVERLNKDREAATRLIRGKDQAIESLQARLEAAEAGVVKAMDQGNDSSFAAKKVKELDDEVRTLRRQEAVRTAEIEKLERSLSVATEAAAGSSARNELAECRKLIRDLEGEKRTLETEVARLATANARDADDPAAGVQQWVQERKYMSAEVQRVKEKLEQAERSAKADTAVRDRLQKRVNSLEETVRSLGSEQRQRARPAPGGGGDFGADLPSEALYEALQKELGHLRAAASDKEVSLAEKDLAVEALVFKADTLERAREADDKRAKQERLGLKKELAAIKADLEGAQEKAKGQMSELKKENLDLKGKIRALQKKATSATHAEGGAAAGASAGGGAGSRPSGRAGSARGAPAAAPPSAGASGGAGAGGGSEGFEFEVAR